MGGEDNVRRGSQGFFERLILLLAAGFGENDVDRDHGRLEVRDHTQSPGEGFPQAQHAAVFTEGLLVNREDDRVRGRLPGRPETQKEVVGRQVDESAGCAPADEQPQC